jgi:hypothetical protein
MPVTSRTSMTYRVTPEMLRAGANAMAQCHALGGHTAETACLAIFTAMLNAADSHPGANLRKSFAWSSQDGRRNRAMQRHHLTRADYDANGERRITLPDGRVVIRFVWDVWYLRDAWKAEQLAKKHKVTKS